VHMLNLEKGQKHVSQVFDDWTDGLPDFGPVSMCCTKFPVTGVSSLCLVKSKLRLSCKQAVHAYTLGVHVMIRCSHVCYAANS